ncbi:MAG: hypothetical protein RR060_05145, partial [Victivallaceae bacterium]
DQRGYGVANGYRDIGAFEASGTYAYANGRGYSSIAELLARPEAATDGVFNITLADTRITDRNIRLDGKINITGGVDADGNVLTYFDANNLGRVFNITSEAAMVSLSNLILMNGAAMKTSVLGSDGGGLIANSGNLTLTNITGKNSFAQNAGGAVYSTLNLVVNDSLFSNNRANVGGGIYASGTSVTAKDVTFFANYGHNGGGMYVQNLNFTGSGLVFNNNYATNDAGGLYIVGDDTTVIDIASSFKENYVLGRGAAMNMLGGATFKGNLDVSNNISIFDGGGIYMLNTSEIDISGNFRGNRSGFGIGGGAYIGNVVKSLRLFADFKFNQADGDGGGLYAYGNVVDDVNMADLNISKSSFEVNSTLGSGGGAYIYSFRNVSFRDVSFGKAGTVISALGNSAYGDGGGLHVSYVDTFEGEDLRFGGNIAGESQGKNNAGVNTGLASGGAAYLLNVGSITIDIMRVSDNLLHGKSARNQATHGGMVIVADNVDRRTTTHIQISNADFLYNSLASLYVDALNAVIKLDSSSFDNQYSALGYSYGAVIENAVSMYVVNSTFAHSNVNLWVKNLSDAVNGLTINFSTIAYDQVNGLYIVNGWQHVNTTIGGIGLQFDKGTLNISNTIVAYNAIKLGGNVTVRSSHHNVFENLIMDEPGGFSGTQKQLTNLIWGGDTAGQYIQIESYYNG